VSWLGLWPGLTLATMGCATPEVTGRQMRPSSTLRLNSASQVSSVAWVQSICFAEIIKGAWLSWRSSNSALSSYLSYALDMKGWKVLTSSDSAEKSKKLG